MDKIASPQKLVADIAQGVLGIDAAQVQSRLDDVVQLDKVPAAQRATIERLLPGKSQASLLEIYAAARNHRGGYDRAGSGNDVLEGASTKAIAEVPPLTRTRQELAVALAQALSRSIEAGTSRSGWNGFTATGGETLKYLQTGAAISSFEVGLITDLMHHWRDVPDVASVGQKLIFALEQEKADAGYVRTLGQDLSHYWSTRRREGYSPPLIGDVLHVLSIPLDVVDLFVLGSRHKDLEGRRFHR
ncbi:MAG: hypothetical protein ACAI38_12915 [Myxococcota bacterium]